MLEFSFLCGNYASPFLDLLLRLIAKFSTNSVQFLISAKGDVMLKNCSPFKCLKEMKKLLVLSTPVLTVKGRN